MDSNSPVLLLAPTATPTPPSLAPMKVAPPPPPPRVLPPAMQDIPTETKPSLVLPTAGLAESAESGAMRELAPITPTEPTPASATPAAVGVSKSVSPREPTTKTAATTSPPLPPSTAPSVAAVPATSIATLPSGMSSNVPGIASSSLSPAAGCTSTPAIVTAPQAPMSSMAAPLMGTASATSAAPSSAQASPSTTQSSAAVVASSPKPVKSNTGRWTEAEHKLFLKGLEQFPYRAWKKIATLIKTRTVVQIRTHAQKYYQKLEKEEQRLREREAQLALQQQQQQQQQPQTPVPSASSTVGSTPSAAAVAPGSSRLATTTPTLAQTTDAIGGSSSTPSTPVPNLPSPLSVHPHLQLSASSPTNLPIVSTPAATIAEETGAPGKKKGPMRKRKSSTEDPQQPPQSSIPKRMMKEKKFFRERTMSPKQKTLLTTARVFSFGDQLNTCENGKGRGFHGAKLGGNLDFDETSANSHLILDFADEKPMMEDPFGMDGGPLDHGLVGMDNDDLLQLSDDESLDWFSTAHEDGDDEAKESGPSSPLNFGRHSFSPLYAEEEGCLPFPDLDGTEDDSVAVINSTQCSTPSPILASTADCSEFGLSDEDDDFVLDPEKFLSSYFSPDDSTTSS